ncbi:hypothetical protein WR25_10036 [Diploscapter pachys]|uniref:Thioesterase domain-containing protein n=1 Tax=Diploscapter pachys TaxID=2018661 RepID=A0A2A2JA62_9BILA|nr:hypothetical protein WR25_10036 [Diploscapter pachys]
MGVSHLQARPLIIESGRVVVEFEVTQEMANPRGTLHGGCLTALVDVSTTMAGVALRGATGMSTNMHVNFIAPVKVGETVRMDSVITKSGKTLAYARSDLFLKEGNKPVATALHTLIYPNNNR